MKQSREALGYMRKFKDFSDPVSIGILVIRISRAISKTKDIEKQKQDIVNRFVEISEKLHNKNKVDFLARYDAPSEMQSSSGWGKNEDVLKLFPGIIFSACIWQRQA
jgi:hypothetical protein